MTNMLTETLIFEVSNYCCFNLDKLGRSQDCKRALVAYFDNPCLSIDIHRRFNSQTNLENIVVVLQRSISIQLFCWCHYLHWPLLMSSSDHRSTQSPPTPSLGVSSSLIGDPVMFFPSDTKLNISGQLSRFYPRHSILPVRSTTSVGAKPSLVLLLRDTLSFLTESTCSKLLHIVFYRTSSPYKCKRRECLLQSTFGRRESASASLLIPGQ